MTSKYTIRLGKEEREGIEFVAKVSGLNQDVDESTPQHFESMTLEILAEKVSRVIGDSEWEVRIDADNLPRLQGGERRFLDVLDGNLP